MIPPPPRFLSWPPQPTPIQRLPKACPVCQQPAAANELKAYGRCESCHTEPRVGMPANIAKPKRRSPKPNSEDSP